MTGLVPATGVEAAAWLPQALAGFASTVGSVVPVGYSAYARLLHPVGAQSDGGLRRVPWQEAASQAGRTVDGRTHWEDLCAALPDGGRGLFEPPLEGTLDPTAYAALAAVLRTHTRTPQRCWFGLWDGYGAIKAGWRAAPTVALPGRRYYLLSGALPDAAESLCDGPFFQWANLFWPDDRAWFVASEVDFESTYIAASASAIGALRACFPGELYEVGVDQRVTRR